MAVMNGAWTYYSTSGDTIALPGPGEVYTWTTVKNEDGTVSYTTPTGIEEVFPLATSTSVIAATTDPAAIYSDRQSGKFHARGGLLRPQDRPPVR